MFGAIAAAVGGSLVGGLLGAKGAKDAAGIQADAARESTAEQRRQYDISRADLAPWRSAGATSVNRLDAGLRPGGEFTRRFTLADFDADPVNALSLRFGLDEGTKAVRRMFGAQGIGRSGAAAKALSRYTTDYVGSKAADSYGRFYADQDRTFNRNAAVSGVGQTATTNTASLGANTAANIGANLTGAANARGAAAIAGANAYAAPFTQAGNVMSTKFLLDSMKPQTSSPWLAFGDD